MLQLEVPAVLCHHGYQTPGLDQNQSQEQEWKAVLVHLQLPTSLKWHVVFSSPQTLSLPGAWLKQRLRQKERIILFTAGERKRRESKRENIDKITSHSCVI
ncbi:uncharacterized protein LOC143674793 [Tamandua tetradactyla]|uniref:uncharacterized protein LOC143674793 n=1 Tax=Tamandua tetradactyla TaxID=48850 RepID=UPI004053A005